MAPVNYKLFLSLFSEFTIYDILIPVSYTHLDVYKRQDVLWANRLQPDYVGFVFAGRKRRISDLQARKLRKLLDRKIPAVGVFVNEPAEHIIRLVQKDIIQAVQLHGQEGEADIRRIRQAVICPIIQAFSLNGDEDVARAEKSGADYIILDAAGGGSGERLSLIHILLSRALFTHTLNSPLRYMF